MAVVETDVQDQTMLIRLNRPERMNALGFELRTLMAEAWIKFEESKDLEVAIITGTGKGFCAGEDMKEALERGAPGSQSKPVADPLKEGKVTKPVIAAVNGFAMGGGFMLVYLKEKDEIFYIDYRSKCWLNVPTFGSLFQAQCLRYLKLSVGYWVVVTMPSGQTCLIQWPLKCHLASDLLLNGFIRWALLIDLLSQTNCCRKPFLWPTICCRYRLHLAVTPYI